MMKQCIMECTWILCKCKINRAELCTFCTSTKEVVMWRNDDELKQINDHGQQQYFHTQKLKIYILQLTNYIVINQNSASTEILKL